MDDRMFISYCLLVSLFGITDIVYHRLALLIAIEHTVEQRIPPLMVFAARHASSCLTGTRLGFSIGSASRTFTIHGKQHLLPRPPTRVGSIAHLHNSRRQTYRHLANSEPTAIPKPTAVRSTSSQSASTTPPASATTNTPAGVPISLNDAPKVSDKEQRLTDWAIVRKLAGNIWPSGPGSREIKIRVVGALGLLVAGKVSSVAVIYKLLEHSADSCGVDLERASAVLLQADCGLYERGNYGIVYGLALGWFSDRRM
jgi:hypothetical protein